MALLILPGYPQFHPVLVQCNFFLQRTLAESYARKMQSLVVLSGLPLDW